VLAVPEVGVPADGKGVAECVTQQEMETAASMWRQHFASTFGRVPFQPPNPNNTGCDVVHVDGPVVRLYEVKTSETNAAFSLSGKMVMSLLGLWDCIVREVFAVPVEKVELVFVVASRTANPQWEDATCVSYKRLASLCPGEPWGVAGWTISPSTEQSSAHAAISMNPRRNEAGKQPCVVNTLGDLRRFFAAAGISLPSPRFITSEREIFELMTPTVAALLPDVEKIFNQVPENEASCGVALDISGNPT
jgi:hypothetical protein